MKSSGNIVVVFALWALGILSAGCDVFGTDDPYQASLKTLTVIPVFPEGTDASTTEGVTVNIGDMDKGSEFNVLTGADGKAVAKLPGGNYRLTIGVTAGEYIFNGSADKVVLNKDVLEVKVEMVRSRKGELVIKEIYCGGCLAYPHQGQYQSDKYIIVHNNSPEIQYLDNLCVGTLDPYNAIATNVWVTTDEVTGATVFNDFVPVIQAVWKITGDGQTFPLAPGEDAVICFFGAIDHTVTYPLSVNLDKPDYFVCYDNVLFPNTLYHPAPGHSIDPKRYLEVVIKTGQSNAYTLSLNSPAIVLFRAEGQTIEDFVKVSDNVVQKPGSTVDRVVKVPVDWVLDGVEVFTGNTAGNVKRLSPATDAGFIPFSAPYLGHTLYRNTDEEATASAGYEVLADTNNSMKDFFERNVQSLSQRQE